MTQHITKDDVLSIAAKLDAANGRNAPLAHALCNAAIQHYIDSAAPAQPVSGWLPIESAPKDGVEIILAHPDGSMCIGWWKARGGSIGWTDGDTYAMSWPTHWQPKPPSPIGK
jgi:hypothetical protein